MPRNEPEISRKNRQIGINGQVGNVIKKKKGPKGAFLDAVR